jgi:hypothetical protein
MIHLALGLAGIGLMMLLGIVWRRLGANPVHETRDDYCVPPSDDKAAASAAKRRLLQRGGKTRPAAAAPKPEPLLLEDDDAPPLLQLPPGHVMHAPAPVTNPFGPAPVDLGGYAVLAVGVMFGAIAIAMALKGSEEGFGTACFAAFVLMLGHVANLRGDPRPDTESSRTRMAWRLERAARGVRALVLVLPLPWFVHVITLERQLPERFPEAAEAVKVYRGPAGIDIFSTGPDPERDSILMFYYGPHRHAQRLPCTQAGVGALCDYMASANGNAEVEFGFVWSQTGLYPVYIDGPAPPFTRAQARELYERYRFITGIPFNAGLLLAWLGLAALMVRWARASRRNGFLPR